MTIVESYLTFWNSFYVLLMFVQIIFLISSKYDRVHVIKQHQFSEQILSYWVLNYSDYDWHRNKLTDTEYPMVDSVNKFSNLEQKIVNYGYSKYFSNFF